jgi:hypothetical protein
MFTELAHTLEFCEAYFVNKAKMEASEDFSVFPKRTKMTDRLAVQRRTLDRVIANYRDNYGG